MTEEKKYKNSIRLLVLAGAAVLVAVFIGAKLVLTYVSEGPELRAKAEREVLKRVVVKADRGNIYSSDGKLLATSMPMYDLYMDPTTASDEAFNSGIVQLSHNLARVFPKRNFGQWRDFLKNARSSGDRFVTLGSSVTFTQLQKIKEWPIFELGKFKGGLIYESRSFRKMPLGKLAERTIGYDGDRNQAGLEGAFSSFLKGRDGRRMKQKISNSNWKPLNDASEIEPENGYDLVTTIDTRIQDVAHRALLAQLEKYEADHGSVIVMEVKTGHVKAISNLGRTEEGKYYEKRNYAIWETTEPGSTFKLASLMVALEDGVVDTSDMVDTENGIYTIYNKKVKDSNVKYGKGGYGVINVAEAFRKSSNVGIVKAIYPHYKNNEKEFIDRLYQIGLNQKLGVEIKGEGQPKIPTPSDQNWSGISLPWISFGYEISMTPMQVLALYNAVANNGVMVKPILVESIQNQGEAIEVMETEILNPAICSKSTVEKLQALLKGVVDKGTAKNIQTDVYTMAGKTGTCQLNYWKASREYQASFAGYFPAENPQYSCIVVVNKPNPDKGYYGSTVAAPVFRAIADEVYLYTPENIEVNYDAEEVPPPNIAIQVDNVLPDLTGLAPQEVIPLLENKGFKVQVSGAGNVVKQFPKPGTALKPNQLIIVKLG